jgi:hypothetical protein
MKKRSIQTAPGPGMGAPADHGFWNLEKCMKNADSKDAAV